ncbi:MAG: hypothetical protein OHK0052_09400 [Anaerolineales bacterium]
MTEPNPAPAPARPFWLRYLQIMGIVSAIVFALAWLMDDMLQVSNFYFLSSLVLFGIAIIPVFAEVGGNVRVVGRLGRGETMRDIVQQQEKKAQRGAQQTYLYGFCGLTAFVLAILFL